MIIYLAGAETWWETFLDAGIRNMLFSYYYMRTMRRKVFDRMMEGVVGEKERRAAAGEKPLRLFLDSGGFTYINHKGTKPDPRVYWKDYLDFVKGTAETWDLTAELDIEDHDSPEDVGVSLEQVDSWREELIDEVGGLTTILPVWHDWRSPEDWTSYCQDSRLPYMALSSYLTLGLKNKLCHEAHRSGKLVHGFAETKMQTEMKYLKCDSVDSTTWLRATKYGGLFIFHANQLRILDHKHKDQRKLFRSYFKNNGIDMAKIMSEDQKELTKCSLIAWRNLSERLELVGERKRHAQESRSEDGNTENGEEVDDSRRPRGPARGGEDSDDGLVHREGDGRADDADDRGEARASGYVRQREIDGDDGGVQASVRTQGDEVMPIGKKPTTPAKKVSIKLPIAAVRQLGITSPGSGQRIAQKLPTSEGWSRLPDANDLATWAGDDGLPICIKARAHTGRTKHYWSDHEIEKVNAIGARLGCWSCGAKEPGTPKGNWVLDHFPFISDEDQEQAKMETGSYQPQVLIPQCHECSNSQGGQAMANRGSIHAKCEHGRPRGSACSLCARKAEKEAATTTNLQDIVQPGMDKVLNCVHGRPGGHLCPHCAAPVETTTLKMAAEEARKRFNEHWPICTLVNISCKETGPGMCADGMELYLPIVKWEREKEKHEAAEKAKWEQVKGQLTLTGMGLPPVDMGEGAGKQIGAGGIGAGKAHHLTVLQGGMGGTSGEGAGNLGAGNHQGSMGGQHREGWEAGHLPGQPQSFQGSLQSNTEGMGASGGRIHLPVIEDQLRRVQKGLPATECSNCAISGDCKEYKEGAACYYDKLFRLLPVRDIDAVVAYIENFLEMDKSRTYRAMITEALTTGGQLDPRVSAQIDGHLQRVFLYHEKLKQIQGPRAPGVNASIHARGPGVLQQLFGGIMNKGHSHELPLNDEKSVDEVHIEISAEGGKTPPP